MAVVEVTQVVKKYKTVTALQGVSLKVEKGEIYGLLGRNGAGKSTLVKILLNIVHAGGGEAKLFNTRVDNPNVRKLVGFLPEDHRLPEYHSAQSYLGIVGRLYGIGSADRARRTGEVLELVGLKDRSKDKIRGYSKGMRQRLGIAQALYHNPELIFLDEPTDGVDPVGRREIRDFILRLKQEGKTIFINSHLLNEVEMTCDRVAIIEQGQLVREGGVEELTRTENVFEIKLAGDFKPALEKLLAIATWVRPSDGGVEVQVADPAVLDEVVDALRAARVGIRGLAPKVQSLEDVFLRTIHEERP
jgi:ABC-2 type transport system ATP-binding protein